MPLEHAEITSKILEASFEVAKELGTGFLESVYQKALEITLAEKRLKVQPQAHLTVYFRGQPVGEFIADMIVEDLILVELKAVKDLVPEHQAQVINYLKATRLPVGMLINFGNPKLQYHRLHNKFLSL